MDYTEQKCTACGLEFTKGDDIVVCPICGTPHHTECYELWSHCINEDKHKDNYDWSKEHKPVEQNKCTNCGYVNEKDMLFCGKCGKPFEKGANAQKAQQPPIGNPFFRQNADGTTQIKIDKMAGVDPKEVFDEDVTGEDLTNIAKTSQFYYMSIFNRIKNYGSSKFNFSAFVFSGAWWLYRKMYAVGIVLFSIYIVSSILQLAYTSQAFEIASSLIRVLGSNPTREQILNAVNGLSQQELFTLVIPYICDIVKFICMLVSGFIANRSYYKHCKKKIQKVKSEEKNPMKVKNKLTEIGGIDSKAGLACGILFIVLTIAGYLV